MQIYYICLAYTIFSVRKILYLISTANCQARRSEKLLRILTFEKISWSDFSCNIQLEKEQMKI